MAEPASGSPDIEIRDLTALEQIFEASLVLAEVWGGDNDAMPPNLLRALASSGNYVVGLYDGERMIGASAAFFGPPASRSMHSHITGVLPEYQARGLGRQLKEHQRQWAFGREVGRITWTFDPLIARNAHFNLNVLGVRVLDYLVDHYGPMDDGLNRGDESDRLYASWALAAPAGPPREEDVVTTVEIPADIETMRVEHPGEAVDWRFRLREQFMGLLQDGLVVGGFDDRGYLFVRA